MFRLSINSFWLVIYVEKKYKKPKIDPCVTLCFITHCEWHISGAVWYNKGAAEHLASLSHGNKWAVCYAWQTGHGIQNIMPYLFVVTGSGNPQPDHIII